MAGTIDWDGPRIQPADDITTSNKLSLENIITKLRTDDRDDDPLCEYIPIARRVRFFPPLLIFFLTF